MIGLKSRLAHVLIILIVSGPIANGVVVAASETNVTLNPAPDAFVDDVTDAAKAFLNTLTDEQKAKVLYEFTDKARTTGTDTANTPSFCAVLAWCVGWGLTQCSLTYPQHVALQRLLSSALSDAGYQTLLAVMNRNRVIGELEDAGTSGFVSTRGRTVS